MKRYYFFLVITLFIILLSALYLRKESGSPIQSAGDAPRFEEYKTRDVFNGIPATPDFSTNKDALRFKTAITEGAKNGPNFAGMYTVISWGCGTACQQYAILDAKTGVIVLYGNEYISTRGLQFRKDSNLLIVDQYDPAINPDTQEYDFPARYLILENGNLREVYKEGCVELFGKLECGELMFGFITNISDRLISIDTVEFLSGREAREKAALDTGCSVAKVEDCAPSLNNDFYIRNTDKSSKVFTLNTDAAVWIQKEQGSPVLAAISLSDFERDYSGSERLAKSPYAFIRQGNTIISIKQQYTP